MAYSIMLLVSLFSIIIGYKEGADLSITYRKYAYQKDMSEYCRRRVMPSVFLSRQVVEANSQVLHFSRLEVPYSCYVNIRTEMSNNIIVVIQVITDIDLQKTCKQGDNQLLIYELGETFGGYWGQLPDSVMKKGIHRDDRTYTLKTTQTEPTTTSKSTTTITTTETKTTKEQSKEEENYQGYLTMELPIVNVSAELVPGNLNSSSSFSTEDNFIYDVVPWPDTLYETSMVPLFEVALDKNKAFLRDAGQTQQVNFSPEFQIQFNDLFTPDPRLTLPPFDAESSKRKSYKYLPIVNNRLNFKKNKELFDAKATLFNKKQLLKFRQPKLNLVRSKLILQPPIKHDDEGEGENKINSWSILHKILENLTKADDRTTQPPHQELANILRGISNTGFNKSVYLAPNLANLNTARGTTQEHKNGSTTTMKISSNYNTSHFHEPNATWKQLDVLQDSNKFFNKSNTSSNDSAINKDLTVALLPLTLDVDSIILNVTNQKTKDKDSFQNQTYKAELKTLATITAKKLEAISVPLVNHESWENIVNAAPEMAVKLNQEKVTATHDTKRAINGMKPRLSKVRKKRYIHAIDIDIAKPHHVPVMKHLTTAPPPEKFDLREFQRLIELQDDEIHDRVAMRYLRQYVGLPLLNFCDINETSTSTRHVYLFNSSRLVLALSNFTLKRMTVVVTPARTLLRTDARCAAAHLECQVSGARVCIDAHSACDGVPNCGSYDIYDEDRQSCGAATGLRHNVCLAAITSLAVLLTVLYTIHYWLKRCVPRVSDAFFIYTDAAENVMYLESVMRSPHDVGVGKEFYCGTAQYMECEDIVMKDNILKRFFNRCLNFLNCRRRKKLQADIIETELDNLYPQRIPNFAEIEINRIVPFTIPGADVGVQTDSSLEIGMLQLSADCSKDVLFEQDNVESASVKPKRLTQFDNDSNQPSDELNMLKFFRKARAKSTSSHVSPEDDAIGINVIPTNRDKIEIEFHEYDPKQYSIDQAITADQPIKVDVDDSNKYVKKQELQVRKHLRFREDAEIIPFPHDDEVDEENVESAPKNRRSIVYGTSKVIRIQENDPNESEEPSVSAPREFKSYFNWGKEKKKKKPKKK